MSGREPSRSERQIEADKADEDFYRAMFLGLLLLMALPGLFGIALIVTGMAL